MAGSKPSIDRQAIAEAIAEFLRAQAPEANRKGWYWEIADAIEAHPDTIANICHGKGCDIQTYFRLVEHFGLSALAATITPLTGFHCAATPHATVTMTAELRELLGKAKTMLDQYERANVVTLKNEGSVK